MTKAQLEQALTSVRVENEALRTENTLLKNTVTELRTKRSSGFDANGRRASRPVPQVARPKSARRIQMDEAKAAAMAGNKSVVC